MAEKATDEPSIKSGSFRHRGYGRSSAFNQADVSSQLRGLRGERSLHFLIATQSLGDQSYSYEINNRGHRHDLVGNPIREDNVGNIAPIRQPMDQCRQGTLETVGRISHADCEYDANRCPEIAVNPTNQAAINDVNNAGRCKEEYHRMDQLCLIDPIHAAETILTIDVSHTH